jgi:hypothetical protein
VTAGRVVDRPKAAADASSVTVTGGAAAAVPAMRDVVARAMSGVVAPGMSGVVAPGMSGVVAPGMSGVVARAMSVVGAEATAVLGRAVGSIPTDSAPTGGRPS